MTAMASRRQADKYWFSVEGETEKWYLEWLRSAINADPRATRKVAFDVKVEKKPAQAREEPERRGEGRGLARLRLGRRE